MSIHYRKGEDIVERIVDPLGLVAKGNTWYMIAAVEGDFRSYRISRLLSARISNETFTRPDLFDLAAYWEQSTKNFKLNLPSYPANVHVDEKLLTRIQYARYAKVLTTRSLENGWLYAEIDFQTLESACEYILSWGTLIEVLEPLPLRDAVIKNAKEIVAKYQTP